MKPRSVTATPALLGADLLAVRAAARPPPAPGRRAAALSGAFSPSKLTSMPAFVAFAPTVLVLQHHVVEARGVDLLPHLDQVAVGALHQAVEHLDHVDARAQRRIDGGHLEADDAAADHQHALRDALEQQRAGRIDDTFVVRHEGQLHRLRAGGDDGLGEPRRPSCRRPQPTTSTWCGSRKLPTPVTTSTLRALAMPARPPVSFLTTPSLKPRRASMSISGAAYLMPWWPSDFDLVHHAGGVQQRLRRDAADVQARRRRAWHSARRARSSCRCRRCGRPPNSRPGRRRARAPRTRDRPCRRSCRRRCGASAAARCARRCSRRQAPAQWPARRRSARGLDHQDHRPLADLVAELDLECP